VETNYQEDFVNPNENCYYVFTKGETMFIGHLAIAFAVKRAVPRTSLGTTFLAVQFLDLLWPLFLLLGWEHVRIVPGITVVSPLDLYDYPISHSLVGSLIWSAALGIIYYVIRKDTKTSFVIAICVFSHWILDFITHRPDMPLSFGSTGYVGLGLWNSLWGTLIIEIGLFIVGVTIYLRTTKPINRRGTIGSWGLVVFLFVAYLASLVGAPPPNERALAIAANASWLLVIWTYWIDKHRSLE
jgi:hypothetical protein